MELSILCIGDVVGSPGRLALREGLTSIRASRQIDCVIANVENVAGGSGLTPQLYEKMRGYGVNLFTLGDHIYRRREIIPILETSDNIVRPANLPTTAPGREFAIYHTSTGQSIAVVSVLGRLFMKTMGDCPYAAVDRTLRAIPKTVSAIVVDMHAEATSEKVAMGWHLDGRASVLFGTHTHIQTADERVLPKGTAYITDLGMTGPYDSVLGRDKKRVLATMATGLPNKFDVATDDARLCGIIVTVDTKIGRATQIERVCYEAKLEDGQP